MTDAFNQNLDAEHIAALEADLIAAEAAMKGAQTSARMAHAMNRVTKARRALKHAMMQQ